MYSDQKGIEPLENFEKTLTKSVVAEDFDLSSSSFLLLIPPPHSSFKGESLNHSSNHNPTLKTHTRRSKRKASLT